MNNGMNIYVGNVARNVSEEQLRQVFSQCGMVNSVKLVKDRFTGEVRGFAFVEMANADEGKQAIEQLNGYDLEGQRLRINEARPREENGRGGFGAGDRGPRRPSFGGPRTPRF